MDKIAIWLHSKSCWIRILKSVDRETNRPPNNMRHLRSYEVWRRIHLYIRAYISQGPPVSIFTVVNEVCKWYIIDRLSDQLGACSGDSKRQLPRCHVRKIENRPVSSSLGDYVKKKLILGTRASDFCFCGLFPAF